MKRRFSRKTILTGLSCLFVLAFASVLVADDPPQFGPWSAPVNLGSVINTNANEQGPGISKDGLSMYFQSNRPGGFGGDDIWVVQRPSVDAPWGAPQNLGSNINTPSSEAAPYLSVDGHSLFFHSNRPGGFGGADIYVSRRHNKRDDFGWQPAENLGSGVNSPDAEQQPCVFEDDNTGAITLYFASDRPNGVGGFDIYASTLQSDESFGLAVAVPELNSASNDRGPTIRRDGLEIIFSSNRPGSLGDLALDDLWVSTRPSTTDAWSVPVNLGSVVNDVATDAQPQLSFDGTTLFFNSLRAGGFGGFDIWVTTRQKLFTHDE